MSDQELKDQVTEETSAETAQNVHPMDETATEQSKIEALEQEVASLKDTVLRKAADFENLKRRTERDRFAYFEQAKVDALRDFLPLNDDLVRSIDAAKNLEVDQKFLEGVQMVADKFAQVFAKYQVVPINEANVPFDVNVHDALLQQPGAGFDVKNNPAFASYTSGEEIPSNTVLAVLEPGYKMGERVIRHAKVIVSI